MPMAAPTRRRPLASLQALGYFWTLSMSFMVIRPRRRLFSSTTRSFSMRCSCRCRLASAREVPMGTVINLSLVITSATRTAWASSTKRTSRLVRMPTRHSPSTTGRPETRKSDIRSRASCTELRGEMVTGSRIMPLSLFLTRSTSRRWRSTGMFLWIMPMPPIRAMEMAMADSVTVSMAAESRGMRRGMEGVSQVVMSTASGVTSE